MNRTSKYGKCKGGKELKRLDITPDWPKKLVFKNKHYTFTGKFETGTQNECKKITEELGGFCSPSDEVTFQTDVLVVGALGNMQYKWKTYGLKMRRAAKLRKSTGKPLIILEDRWEMSLSFY